MLKRHKAAITALNKEKKKRVTEGCMGPIEKEKEETAKIMKKAVSWNKVVNHLTPPNMSDWQYGGTVNCNCCLTSGNYDCEASTAKPWHVLLS